MFDWAISGVNKSVPRNAGPECADYLTADRRQIETIVVVFVTFFITYWGYTNLSEVRKPTQERRDFGGKRTLLIFMSLIWGMEIGYKFSSRTVIYLLNPCHITTAMQIYLLAASPSKTVTAVFRIHLNFLNGPLLAFLFPETDSRILPLEAAIYWIQHGMMFVVPYYLLRLGGVYNIENLKDLSWNALGYGLNMAYHFFVLQGFAIPAQVNLNHMLCPAILDPFGGPYYRMIALVHQAILCPLLCKLFCILSYFVTNQLEPLKNQSKIEYDVKKSMQLQYNSVGNNINGHPHTE